jgi:hypothetical protein
MVTETRMAAVKMEKWMNSLCMLHVESLVSTNAFLGEYKKRKEFGHTQELSAFFKKETFSNPFPPCLYRT